MSARVPFIPAHHERWKQLRERGCENLIELVSQSRDPDYASYGSSAFMGDLSGPGVIVPPFGTTSQTNRFLFRLCGIQIPGGFGVIVRGLRQAATLRTILDVDDEPLPLELEVTSPFWHFRDGNVSWHLMWQGDSQSPHRTTFDTGTGIQQAGTTPQFRDFSGGSALVYQAYDSVARTYTAPAMGRPPGGAVAHLGNIHDIRYPWGNTDWSQHLPVMGPGALVLYASVFQPGNTARVDVPGCIDTSALRPEDRFVAAYPDAIYGRVAGAMTVELFPCCGAKT